MTNYPTSEPLINDFPEEPEDEIEDEEDNDDEVYERGISDRWAEVEDEL